MKFDNPVPRDREMDLKESELREGKYSVNEIRNLWDGSPPVTGGDVVLIDGNKIPLTSAGKVLPGAGGDDDTPEYDTEHDPGGDESEKTLDDLLDTYNRILEYTNGWSWKKAEEFARGYISFMEDGKLKDLFVYSVKNGLEISDFKSRIITFLAEEVAKKL